MKTAELGILFMAVANILALIAIAWRIDHIEGRLRVLERSVGNIQIEMAIEGFKAKGMIPGDAVRIN